VTGAISAFALATLPLGLEMKGLFIFFIFFGFVLVTWFLVLTPEERNFARQLT
jgi:hypothetical protein